MLKILLSSFFALSLVLSVQAQTAQEWLDRVSNTYNQASSYYINFEFQFNEGDEVQIGELFAVKEKFSLQVMDITQMYDGKLLYTISKDDKEVTILKPDENSNDFLTPTKILYTYKNNFTPTLDKTTTIDGVKVQQIKLTPNQSNEYDYIMIAIDVSTKTIKMYNEYLNSGEVRSIKVKEYLESLIIPRALFKFDQSKYEKDGYIVTQL